MTPAQCRAGRALIELKQPALAEKAGLGLSTIVDFERGRRAVSAEVVAAIARALEAAGVEFTNGGQPGVRMAPKGLEGRSESVRQSAMKRKSFVGVARATVLKAESQDRVS